MYSTKRLKKQALVLFNYCSVLTALTIEVEWGFFDKEEVQSHTYNVKKKLILENYAG